VFGSGKVNVETWRCATTLRGHNGDVLDMAWSPHDAWLATCSVDNTVIVWNALKMPGEFHITSMNQSDIQVPTCGVLEIRNAFHFFPKNLAIINM
jgi:WD40 repeat protein